MKVPYLDLRVQDKDLKKKYLDAYESVMDHGRFIMGPEIEVLEKKICSLCQSKFSFAVSSGTAAIFLALKSLQIGHGDEVIVPALSWISTAHAVRMTGAIPVFADIDKDLNISLQSIQRLVKVGKTKAIICVHWMGTIGNIEEIQRFSKESGFYLIEDAAQAFGASLNDMPVGRWGDITCFSMNPMKVLASHGEAGFVVTDRGDLVERLKALRYCGMIDRERCLDFGLNFRMETILAANLLVSLEGLDNKIARRREIAARYCKELRGIVDIPVEKEGAFNIYYGFTVLASNRNELLSYLLQVQIECKIQHQPLMCQQKIYRDCDQDVTYAREVVEKIICLPLHEKMSDEQVEYVISGVRNFYENR